MRQEKLKAWIIISHWALCTTDLSLIYICQQVQTEASQTIFKFTCWSRLQASKNWSWLNRYYSLADVGYGVHPAANADLIAYIWWVAELVHYSNVIGIGPLEELTLQCYWINLWGGKRQEDEGFQWEQREWVKRPGSMKFRRQSDAVVALLKAGERSGYLHHILGPCMKHKRQTLPELIKWNKYKSISYFDGFNKTSSGFSPEIFSVAAHCHGGVWK